jgi:hypothetical protein
MVLHLVAWLANDRSARPLQAHTYRFRGQNSTRIDTMEPRFLDFFQSTAASFGSHAVGK